MDINQGILDPLPIAVSDFFPGEGVPPELAQQVSEVIASNLRRSGLFRPIDKSAFSQSPEELQAGPSFSNWTIIDAQALVSGRVDTASDGRIRVEFRLWDTLSQIQLVGLRLSSDEDRWRRIAHQISDAIFRRVTGDEGYFDTRIVYISETGPADRRVKRLAMMDQDGEGHRFLTDGSVLVLTPRFSPRVQQITYLAYYNRKPRVYLFDIESGRQEVLGDFPNMSFAPRFSPDGSQVIMSMAEAGNTDVFTMDLPTRQLRRLTRGPGIETSPSYAPDGSRVCFES
ncbi:MAG: Tol-Pal system protein TolB, partial [Pseudomonadota bacterium]